MEQLGQFFINHWALWLAVIIVGFLTLLNERQIKRKRAEEITPQSAVNLINHDEAVVIDLRELEVFKKGHILNAIHLTTNEFEQSIKKYKSKPLILVCEKGIVSSQRAAQLKQDGFAKPMVLAGGISAWQAASLPLIKK